MAAWRHAVLGAVDLIESTQRPKKVWKHLFDPAEHWERLCAKDIRSAQREAETVLGYRRTEHREIVEVEASRWHRAVSLLTIHHDTIYGPAYRAEMNSPETWWCERMDSSQRVEGLTPRSVFVVVKRGSPSRVITAYRPHPKTKGVDWDEIDLRRYATGRFRRNQSLHMNADPFLRTTAENLRSAATAAPRSVRELWWLASAIGYGRLLATHASVQTELLTAERAWRAADPRLVAELRDALDWETCTRDLASGLKEERSEELEAALANAEELLTVANTIGAEAQAESFCTDAEALLAWAPAEWLHLADYAARRCRMFGGAEHGALRLWHTVEAAVLGAAIRLEEPAVLPAAQLVDRILPQPTLLSRWLQRVEALVSNRSCAFWKWAQDRCDAMDVRRPAPALGGTHDETWEVHGRPAANAPRHHRVFVVDDDEANRNGIEVTSYFTDSDGLLWHIEKTEDWALVFVIAAAQPVDGENLRDVLDQAAQRDDVAVRVRKIQPTQATKDAR